jgi:hypothetical protein
LETADKRRKPTVSAVVADMIDTAVGRTRLTFRTLELWSQSEALVDPCDHADVPGRFYFRFTINDHPTVFKSPAPKAAAPKSEPEKISPKAEPERSLPLSALPDMSPNSTEETEIVFEDDRNDRYAIHTVSAHNNFYRD